MFTLLLFDKVQDAHTSMLKGATDKSESSTMLLDSHYDACRLSRDSIFHVVINHPNKYAHEQMRTTHQLLGSLRISLRK